MKKSYRTAACNRGLWWVLAIAATLLFPAGVHAQGAEQVVSDEARTGLDVTIYNSNVALIRDQRQIKLAKGLTTLALTGVSPSMQPATVGVATGVARLVDLNFAFDLLTPESLLKHSVGRTVRVIKTNPKTGEERVEVATVLSARNGVVLRIGDRIETQVPGRLVYDQLPKTLRESPTLLATVETEEETETTLDIRYLTGGLTWQASYVADINAAETTVSLQALATVTNNSGAPYNDATLRLVAGTINQGPEAAPANVAALGAKRGAAVAADVPAQGVADMHMYPIDGIVALGDQETKQIALFSAPKVKVSKEFRILGNENFHTRRFGGPLVVNAERVLRFKNDKASGLGVPMPAGVVRVYGSDTEAANPFLGADQIRHTAAGQEIRLTLGNAFDITATRRQTNFQTQGLPKNVYEASHEIKLSNATARNVMITVIERIPGDWRILSSSAKHKKVSANRAQWVITVPANSTQTLTYKVRVQL